MHSAVSDEKIPIQGTWSSLQGPRGRYVIGVFPKHEIRDVKKGRSFEAFPSFVSGNSGLIKIK